MGCERPVIRRILSFEPPDEFLAKRFDNHNEADAAEWINQKCLPRAYLALPDFSSPADTRKRRRLRISIDGRSNWPSQFDDCAEVKLELADGTRLKPVPFRARVRREIENSLR